MEPRHADATIRAFLDELASSAATPGGGAAAALVGAMAAALVAMVCNLTIGRPRYGAVDPAMKTILNQAETSRMELIRLVEDDARAYSEVAAASRLPRSTEEERVFRTAALQLALEGAAGPPLEVMERCRALVPLAMQVAAHGNVNVASDAGVAAELAAAGVRGSVVNVRVNLAELKSGELIQRYEARIARAEAGLTDDLYRVSAIVRAKLAPKSTS